MKLSDFNLQPRGTSVHFDVYRAANSVCTSLGTFNIDLVLHEVPRLPIDQRLIDEAGILKEAIKNDFDALYAMIYTAYKWAAENQKWFEMFDLPTDLSYNTLSEIVTGGTISIERDLTNKDFKYHSVVHVSQPWDEEHGLHFLRTDSRWERHDY